MGGGALRVPYREGHILESLDNKVTAVIDPANAVDSKTKTASVIDRLSVGKNESEKLGSWLMQVQKTSKGFLTLTKSDLINFLIRDHKLELSSKELSQIRSDNYDPIRHINWITQELKTALAKNDLAMVALLQSEIKGIELSVKSDSNDFSHAVEIKSAKRKNVKNKIATSTNSSRSLSIADLQDSLPEA